MEVNFNWIFCFLMLVRFVSSIPTATDTSKRKGHQPLIKQQNHSINNALGISDQIKANKLIEIPLKYLYRTENVRFPDKLSKFYRLSDLSFPLQDANSKFEKDDGNNLRGEDGHMGHSNVASSSSHDDVYVPLAFFTDLLSGEQISLLRKYSIDLSKIHVPFDNNQLPRNIVKGYKRKMNIADDSGLKKIKKNIKRIEPQNLHRNYSFSTKGSERNGDIPWIASEISESALFVYATDKQKGSQETLARSLKAEQAIVSISVNDTSTSDKSDTFHKTVRKLTELGEETDAGNKLIYSIALPGNSQDQGHVDGKWVTQRRLGSRQLKSLIEDKKEALSNVVASEAKFQLSRREGTKTRNGEESDEMVRWKMFVRKKAIGERTLTQSLSTPEATKEDARRLIISMKMSDKTEFKNKTKKQKRYDVNRSVFDLVRQNAQSSVDEPNTSNRIHRNGGSFSLLPPNSAGYDHLDKSSKHLITETTTIYESIQSVPKPALWVGSKGRKMKEIHHRVKRDLEDFLGNSTVGPTLTALDNATFGTTVTMDTTVDRKSYTTGNFEDTFTIETDMVTTGRPDVMAGGENLIRNEPQGDVNSPVVSFNLLISIQSDSSILFIMPSFVLLTLLGLVAAAVRRWQAVKKAQTREQLLPPARGKDGDYSMDNPLAIDIDAPSTSKYLPGISSENSSSPEISGGLFTVSGGNGYPLFNTFPHRSKRGTQERTSSFDSSRQCCCSWCLIQNNDVQTTRL